MFRIEQDSFTLQYRVYDPDRDASIEWIEALHEERRKVLKLTVGRRVIPFEISAKEVGEGANFHLLTRIARFGWSPIGEITATITSYRFTNQAEFDELLKIAIEGLTIFGTVFNGEEMPPDFYRVLHDAPAPPPGQRGRLRSDATTGPSNEVTRSDFGYR